MPIGVGVGLGLGNWRGSGGGAPSFVPSGAMGYWNFTTGQYWPWVPTTEFADTRASDQYVTNADGSLVKKASGILPISDITMLVEPARTNLVLRSQAMATAPWSTFSNDTGDPVTVTNNAALAPDGTMTAASVTVGRSTANFTSFSEVYQNFTGTVAAHSEDIWLKASTGADVGKQINLMMGNGGTAAAALVTLTAAWQPVPLENFTLAVGSQIACGFGGTEAGLTQIGTVNFDVWQADVQLGATITSPIATGAASATRAANAITIQRTGVGSIVFTFDDDSTQTISGIDTGTQYTIPTNLNRRLIKAIAEYATYLSIAITSVTLGTTFQYNATYPTKSVLTDTFYNTWDDQNKIISTTADMLSGGGWQGDANDNANITIAELSAYDSSVVGSNINRMTSWGQFTEAGSDGKNYKPTGLISVRGTLYCAVTRMTGRDAGNGYTQPQDNAQIIKSTDHGLTWTPSPPGTAQAYASPMFPGGTFGSPSPIQYGQDYQSQTAHNSDVYVYWMSPLNIASDANSVILGRVKISEIPLLDATKYSYYKGNGANGMLDANWDSNFANATPIISNTGWLGEGGAQFIPQMQRYLYLGTRYPSIHAGSPSLDKGSTVWPVYESPTPWGPWTQIQTLTWNPLGLYFPAFVPKSVVGNTLTIAAAGDYGSQNPNGGLYTLFYIPLALNT